MRPSPFVAMAPSVPRVAVTAVAAGMLLSKARSRKATATQDPIVYADQKTQQLDTPALASGKTARWPQVHSLQLPRSITALLATLTSLHSVRCYQKLAQSIWLVVAMGAAALKTWAQATLPNLQYADVQHRSVPAVDLNTVQMFCGTWVKDAGRSESMDGFCQLFGVPRWLRQATRLMTGLVISTSGDVLLVKQVCKISWLSTTESFPLDGVHTSLQKRRDMRSGKQTGQLLSASGSIMQLHVVWEGNLAGEAQDTLQLVQAADNRDGGSAGCELVVLHEAAVAGRGVAVFKEVYWQAKS